MAFPNQLLWKMGEALTSAANKKKLAARFCEFATGRSSICVYFADVEYTHNSSPTGCASSVIRHAS